MLEVKNLTKEYRPKKGAPVKALDNVSLKFPSKGMVFILGKSGSGKSTLLNLLGGLDRYDSGEIIINGKSSADFSRGDFDSYRNTYLGFIFQEFNILNEFNVAANIALALDLQGVKATDGAVEGILREVDLSDYGLRKPSELSGGEKQRVAIARALVKNPRIILADEPTGSLDSKTGLQIFDLLKRLSSDKLVIVITHDREFAESYGDRVIELKDGKVISDIEKQSGDGEERMITLTANNEIAIRAGYQLTPSDLEFINTRIKENPEIKIVTAEKSLEKNVFAVTDESKIKYDCDEASTLKKSRMPIKNTVKIGASSLKNKPIRLIFTIILSFIAFTLFGIADTIVAYDKAKTATKALNDSDIKSLSITLEQFDRSYYKGVEYTNTVRLDDNDVLKLSEEFGFEFRPVYYPSDKRNSISTSFYNHIYNSYDNSYYASSFKGVMEIDKEYIENFLKYDYVGKIPTEKDEVAISKYIFSTFAQCGYSYDDNEHRVVPSAEITDEASFLKLNPVLKSNKRTFKITAVIDTQFDEARYSKLKKSKDLEGGSYYEEEKDSGLSMLYSELMEDTEHGYHTLLFGAKGLLDDIIPDSFKEPGTVFEDFGMSSGLGVKAEVSGSGEFANTLNAEFNIVYSVKETEYLDIYFVDENKYALKDGEIVVSFKTFMELLNRYYYYTDRAVMYKSFMEIYNLFDAPSRLQDMEYAKSTLIPMLKETGAMRGLEELQFYTDRNAKKPVKIVGCYLNEINLRSGAIVSDDIYNYYYYLLHGAYSYAIAPAVDKDAVFKAAKYSAQNTVNGKKYELHNGIMSTLNSIDSTIVVFKKAFFYVGLGFALFSALLFANFISTSVAYKKREIGILRALGAKAADVYGIFACESIIIALINFALSAIGAGVSTAVFNSVLMSGLDITISILSFGVRQIALLLAVSVAVALIASFVPAYRISQKKPVDAIRV